MGAVESIHMDRLPEAIIRYVASFVHLVEKELIFVVLCELIIEWEKRQLLNLLYFFSCINLCICIGHQIGG